MPDSEELFRKLRELRAHLGALTDSEAKARKELVQAQAEIRYVKECAELRLREAVSVIDQLHERIESMVDAWQAQIGTHFTGSEEEKAKLLAIVEPFRPQRVAAAVLAPAPPAPPGVA